jgi:hypothetical protein
MGQPEIMNDDEVDLFTESVCKNPGEKSMRECVNDMLIESARKKGRLCASNMKFNPTTVNSQQLHGIICYQRRDQFDR